MRLTLGLFAGGIVVGICAFVVALIVSPLPPQPTVQFHSAYQLRWDPQRSLEIVPVDNADNQPQKVNRQSKADRLPIRAQAVQLSKPTPPYYGPYCAADDCTAIL